MSRNVERFTKESLERQALFLPKGIKDAEEQAVKFQQAWRRVLADVDLIVQGVGTHFDDTFKTKFEDFEDYLKAHHTEITESLTHIADVLISIGESLAKAIVQFGKWGESIDPWIEDKIGIKDAFEKLSAIIVALAVTRIPRLILAFTSLGANPGFLALAAIITAMTGAYAGAQWLGETVAGAMGHPGENALSDQAIMRGAGKIGRTIEDMHGPTLPGQEAPGAPTGDTRNWWQRNAPTWAGGAPPPVGSAQGATDTRTLWQRYAPTALGGRAPRFGTTFREKAPGIMDELMKDYGLSKEEASIVMGNLGHESVGLTAMQEKHPWAGRGGSGWAQWTGPRRREFEAYARENNLDPSSYEANLGFLKKEFSGKYAGAIGALKQAQTHDEKMRVFEQLFEGAGIKVYSSRERYARAALTAYDAAETAKLNRTASVPAPAKPSDGWKAPDRNQPAISDYEKTPC